MNTYCPVCGEVCEIVTDYRIDQANPENDYPVFTSRCCNAELDNDPDPEPWRLWESENQTEELCADVSAVS